VVTENNLADKTRPVSPLSPKDLKLPKSVYHDSITAAVPRKIYQNAHGYHINSISVNSDGETYLSADDLRVNLWNLDIPDQSFSTFHFDDRYS
jgi:serine/threonine-protein phosphatase 2A regulatory subunit B